MKNNLYTAVAASLAAGSAILHVYETGDFQVEAKADDSPLTMADKRAHQVIMKFLSHLGYPILSEEGKAMPFDERRHWTLAWVVDPLDGTKEFIKKNGEFTVNIALVDHGKPVLGVIYVPVKRVLYFASREAGAFRLDDVDLLNAPEDLDGLMAAARRLPLPAEEAGKPAAYTVIGSRSHATPELHEFVKQKRAEHGDVEFLSAGSSLKICRVAEGSADIYPRLGPTMEWDTAAGQAIAECAGRTVTVWETGEPLGYNREDLLNPWFVVA
jgi:3'(2'), 5'-bisphosphate nucleotidase